MTYDQWNAAVDLLRQAIGWMDEEARKPLGRREAWASVRVYALTEAFALVLDRADIFHKPETVLTALAEARRAAA